MLTSFPELPSDIKHVTGLELLGSPLWDDENFFHIVFCLNKVVIVQDKLALLNDPQVELHRWRLSQ